MDDQEPTAPPGYYRDEHGRPIFWDGHRWIEPRNQRLVVGLTTGENVLHAVLSVLTLGLWVPVWLIRRWAGRRVIR